MISVIVPVYNVSDYISSCIESIKGQTYSDIEILLVDDGSTDDSGDICERYAKEDSRVRVIHKPNGGAASARNIGTREAKGEYLTYVDSDDIIHPDYIRILLEGMNGSTDIAVCRYSKFVDELKLTADMGGSCTFNFLSGCDACDRIVNFHITNMIVIWGKLYRSTLKEYLIMPEDKAFEDEFTCYKVMYNAGLVAETDTRLYYYRQREGSLSAAGFSKRNFDKLEALKGAAEWFARLGQRELSLHAMKRYLLTVQIVWSKAYDGKACQYILDTIQKMHKDCYEGNKDSLSRCFTGLEKFTLAVFRISPKMYSIMSKVYLKFFEQED